MLVIYVLPLLTIGLWRIYGATPSSDKSAIDLAAAQRNES
jgi:hypothetical protein